MAILFLHRRCWILIALLCFSTALFFWRSPPLAPRDALTTPHAPPILSATHPPPKPPPRPSHVYRSDGLLEVNPLGRHPILDLMDRAQQAWQQKLAGQSKTLTQAVAEYRRRYGRPPPTGFKAWWNYCVTYSVQLPDEYDQIHSDLEMFWAVAPSDLQALQMDWEAAQDTFTIGKNATEDLIDLILLNLSDDALDMGYHRAAAHVELLSEVEHLLPPFRATFTAHDGPSLLVAYITREQARAAVASKTYVDFNALPRSKALWASECPPGSPLHKYNESARVKDLDAYHRRRPKTFIFDHKASMSPCTHPDHVHLNGYFANHHRTAPVPRRALIPAFTLCKTTLNADILAVPLEEIADQADDLPWHQKPEDRLLWRGSTTGMLHQPQTTYNMSHRLRFVALANSKSGSLGVLPSIASDDDARVGDEEATPLSQLNAVSMDVGFTLAHQCTPAEVCEQLRQQYTFKQAEYGNTAKRFKYLMDIDGNCWSSRFRRLMSTRSLVFKATIYPEWWTDRVMPWVHYVPVKIDYSDLHDSLMFFRGGVNGTGGHDQLAQQIATASRAWTKEFWRKEDQVAYQYRLYLGPVAALPEPWFRSRPRRVHSRNEPGPRRNEFYGVDRCDI